MSVSNDNQLLTADNKLNDLRNIKETAKHFVKNKKEE